MEKTSFRTKISELLKFLGISLGFSVILVALAGFYTLITGFSPMVWSERTFWLSLVVCMLAVTPALASLNDKDDYKRKPEQAPPDMVIGKGDKQIVIERPGRLALRLIVTGAFSFGFSVLIDVLSR